METFCLQCGHRGFPEALVFCTKCQAYALHRYCLDGPVIFTDDVTWFCEDCEAKLVVPPSLDQSKPLLSETNNSKNLEKNAIQARSKLKKYIKKLKKSNKQQKRKIEEKQKKGEVNSGLVAKTKNLSADSRNLSELEHPQRSITCEEVSKLKNECGPAPREVTNSDLGSKCVPASQGATTNDLTCIELDGHVDAQPIIDPIWRGSLYLCDETIGTVSGLLAHLSNLACSKVVEETVLIPDVLHAELLPRSMVWPRGFMNGGPTDKSIALFFFPDSERAEKVFDVLVDHIIQLELALRFMAENAELLIFPSTVLPIQYWRFQAKYYLWGVFRKKQT
ncbi:uncharacterized protein LOC113872789 [Abrus precatorius]|uniref:Uncharacterized protein LOC113872789 n=1 Tax=Abrus precatorius TaxID=3816 RepID=A0A8B8MEY3_ABRPR|nr:uncharacterized protein LOC113872789 [Abrus precatorius]